MKEAGNIKLLTPANMADRILFPSSFKNEEMKEHPPVIAAAMQL